MKRNTRTTTLAAAGTILSVALFGLATTAGAVDEADTPPSQTTFESGAVSGSTDGGANRVDPNASEQGGASSATTEHPSQTTFEGGDVSGSAEGGANRRNVNQPEYSEGSPTNNEPASQTTFEDGEVKGAVGGAGRE